MKCSVDINKHHIASQFEKSQFVWQRTAVINGNYMLLLFQTYQRVLSIHTWRKCVSGSNLISLSQHYTTWETLLWWRWYCIILWRGWVGVSIFISMSVCLYVLSVYYQNTATFYNYGIQRITINSFRILYSLFWNG